MKIANQIIYMALLLCCWSSTTLMGQCPNSYQISSSRLPSCASATDGSLRVNGSTYYSSSSYLWSTGETTQYIYNLSPGNYAVTVTDPTNCAYNVQAFYLAPDPNGPRIGIYHNNCRGTLSASSRFGIAQYVWNTGATDQEISNVVPGVYSVTATDPGGCVGQTEYTVISQTSPITASHTATAATCNNNDGSVTLQVTGGTPPYNFRWYQNGSMLGSSSASQNNLKAGAAKVHIREDSSRCGVVYNVMVPGKSIDVDYSRTSCGLNNASATLNVQDFNNPSITWSTGATSAAINNLSAGHYGVTITDGACTQSDSFDIRTGGQLTVYIGDSSRNCQDRYLVASGYGGAGWIAGYNYLWSTGETTQEISAQQGITYTVTVTDANGCTVIETSTGGNGLPYVNTSAVITDATCGNSDGAIDLRVNGNYQSLVWEPTGATTEDLTNIPAGLYLVTLSNRLGCTRTDSFFVGEFIIVAATDASCNLNNGSASVTTYNMSNPVYTWSNGATTPTITGVAAGTYTVTVVNNGCTVVETVVIANSGTVEANIHASKPCRPDFLTAAPIGGVTPYTFLWSDGSTKQSLANPVVGNNYRVTITDANGCTADTVFTVPSFPVLNATATTTAASCGNKNGTATLMVTGGASPFNYNWSTGTGNVATQNSLFAGQYSAVVTDNNGCEATVNPIIVGGQINLSASAALTHPTSGGNTGAIDITVTGSSALTYLWNNGATTQDLSNVSAGRYHVSIADNVSGCTLERDYRLVAAANGTVSVISGFVRDVSATNTCTGGLLLANRMVRLQPTGQTTFTNSHGHYRFVVSTPGNYTVEYINNNTSTNILCPTTGTILVNGVVLGQNYFSNDFFVTRPPIEDLNIRLVDFRNASPGFPYMTRVRYCNNGNTIQSGTIEYNYEHFLDFNSITGFGSTLTLHDIANNRFLWSYNGLMPGECRYLNVTFDVPVGTALGTNILGTVSIDPVASDAKPSDNVDTEYTTVIGSYDPNDKQVSLYRTGNAWDGGAIYTTDNTLEYTIRFQNTGTAPAQFVIVRDTLDVNLLPETVRELDSKHNMDVTVEDGNILVFTFNNINLPDSSVSQEQSIGFIHFKVDRVAGLPIGTQISNQAAIYFDYNTAIYTNTPVSVIDKYTTVVEFEESNFDAEVHPNPFQRDLLVRYNLRNNSDVQIKLYNQLGQCVYQESTGEQTIGAQQVFLQTANLPAGLYILQVETEEGRVSKKLIKE